jgi:hypothetical protein
VFSVLESCPVVQAENSVCTANGRTTDDDDEDDDEDERCTRIQPLRATYSIRHHG